MEQREHPKKFQGEFYQGIVVEVASTTALVYNELCVMEMAEVVMAVSAPLKPGMCIETPRNADYSSPLYAYRVLEHAYKLDKLGRVKMNALISFPKGFDDPTNVFSMCGWCPDVDRILVMPEFFFKLDGDTKGIKDGVLYQGDIVFALRSAVDPEMVPRQLKVETRWVCVKNSLKEIKDDGTIREFIEKTKKPEVAKRDQKMPIWIRGYEKVFRPEPKAMISSRPSSSQNPTQGVFVDDSRNTSPIGEGMENEQEVDSEPDLEGHYFYSGSEQTEETDGEKSNEWEVDSIFDQAMLKPFIREVTVSGLVTGIHGMHSIVWTLESGLIVKVYERGIVGKWLKLKLDSPQAEEASSFELCDGPPLMNVRFVPSKITEKEKGIVVVTCVCTVIDPSNQPFNSQLGGTSIMYSEQFGRIQTDGKQLPEGIKAGDTVLTEIVPLDQGIGGFELAKCHRIFGSEETSIKVEDSYIPEHIRTLEEWATQLQAIELYSYQKGKDVHSENVIGKSCREKDLNLSIDPMGMKKDLVDEKEITVTAEMEGNEKSQLSTSGVISSVSTQQYFTGNEVDPEGDTVTEDNEGGEGTVQGKEDTVAVDAYTKTLDNSLDSSDVPVKKEVEKDNEKEEKERVSDISIDVIFISREDMWICEKAAAEYDWMKKKKIEESEEEEGEKGDGEGSLMWREEQTVRVERQIVMEKEAEETKEEKGRESEEEEETQNTRVEEDRESEVVERTREEEEGDSEEEEETKEEEERESEERDAESLEETEITGHTVDEKENKENLATRVEEASEKVSAATSLPTVDGHKKDEELATGVLYDEPKSSSYPQPSSTPIATVSADDQPQPSTDQTTNSTRSHIEKQKSSSYNSMATTVMLELLKEEADTTLAKKAVYCFVLRRFEGLVSLISPAEDGKIILKERECEVKGSFDFSSIQCGDWLKVVAYPRKKRTKKDEEIRGFRHVATKVLQHCHWKDVHSSKFLPSVMPQKVIGPFIQFQLTFDLRRQDVLSHGGSDIFYLRDWEYEDIGVTVKKNRLKQHVNTVTLTAPFLIRAWCHCVAAVDGFWLNIRPMTKIEKLNEEDGTWSLVTSEGTDIAMTSGTDNEE